MCLVNRCWANSFTSLGFRGGFDREGGTQRVVVSWFHLSGSVLRRPSSGGWFASRRPRRRADGALVSCSHLTCLLGTVFLSGVPDEALWVLSVAFTSASSAQYQNQNQIWSAVAHSITYCGLGGCQHRTFLPLWTNADSVFWCCLLCGTENGEINQPDMPQEFARCGRAELFPRRGSAGIGPLAVVDKRNSNMFFYLYIFESP